MAHLKWIVWERAFKSVKGRQYFPFSIWITFYFLIFVAVTEFMDAMFHVFNGEIPLPCCLSPSFLFCKVIHNFLSEGMMWFPVFRKVICDVVKLKSSYRSAVALSVTCINRTIVKKLLFCTDLLKFGVVQRLLLERENDAKKQRSSTEKVSIEFSN